MSSRFKINCLKVSTLAVFLLILQTALAQKNAKEIGKDQYPLLDLLLQKNQKLLGQNVVAMVWTDTLVFKKEMGEFNSRTPAPLASASQWLTAALVLQFVDEGKISLDDKVSDYLTVFQKYGKNYITIRHCLSNYTGIQDKGGMFEKKKFESLEQVVDAIAAKEIQTNPGTEFRYSDLGPAIAGRILEVVTKKKFEQLAQQRLFRPLGMRQTSFANLEMGPVNPAAGAKSTADDYMKFLVMVMNEGKYRDRQVLSPASAAELKKIHGEASQIRNAPLSAQGFEYALGAWAPEREGAEAAVLTSVGLFGSWAVVDFKRNYAAVVLPKELLKQEAKGDVYKQMKAAMDEK
jgi:CubicO group peptidase (beta-lactamase class C family)